MQYHVFHLTLTIDLWLKHCVLPQFIEPHLVIVNDHINDALYCHMCKFERYSFPCHL